MIFYFFAAAATALYAIQPIIAKKVQVVVPPFAFIAMTMFILASLALCASFLFERQFRVGSVPQSYFALILVFGVVNFLGFWLFLKAISGIPAPHYQIIGGVLAPILSSLFAYVLLGEAVGPYFFLAMPLAFVTLYLALLR